jgi:hypothetical protein
MVLLMVYGPLSLLTIVARVATTERPVVTIDEASQ